MSLTLTPATERTPTGHRTAPRARRERATAHAAHGTALDFPPRHETQIHSNAHNQSSSRLSPCPAALPRMRSARLLMEVHTRNEVMPAHLWSDRLAVGTERVAIAVYVAPRRTRRPQAAARRARRRPRACAAPASHETGATPCSGSTEVACGWRWEEARNLPAGALSLRSRFYTPRSVKGTKVLVQSNLSSRKMAHHTHLELIPCYRTKLKQNARIRPKPPAPERLSMDDPPRHQRQPRRRRASSPLPCAAR